MYYCHVDSAKFPDGYAAPGINGGLNMLASMNSTIEERARLSMHGHKTFCLRVSVQNYTEFEEAVDAGTEMAFLEIHNDKTLAAPFDTGPESCANFMSDGVDEPSSSNHVERPPRKKARPSQTAGPGPM